MKGPQKVPNYFYSLSESGSAGWDRTNDRPINSRKNSWGIPAVFLGFLLKHNPKLTAANPQFPVSAKNKSPKSPQMDLENSSLSANPACHCSDKRAVLGVMFSAFTAECFDIADLTASCRAYMATLIRRILLCSLPSPHNSNLAGRKTFRQSSPAQRLLKSGSRNRGRHIDSGNSKKTVLNVQSAVGLSPQTMATEFYEFGCRHASITTML